MGVGRGSPSTDPEETHMAGACTPPTGPRKKKQSRRKKATATSLKKTVLEGAKERDKKLKRQHWVFHVRTEQTGSSKQKNGGGPSFGDLTESTTATRTGGAFSGNRGGRGKARKGQQNKKDVDHKKTNLRRSPGANEWVSRALDTRRSW